MKKLLIITQKVDRKDDILGFFHGWLTSFAKHFEEVTVICLYKGDYNLPDNVHVLSLGKEENQSRIQYIRRFYSYIYNEKDNYDAVFVHMNQEYVLLGGLFWHLWGKGIGFWYNHAYGTLWTSLATKIADYVFHTSPYAFTANTKKSTQMPAGIDTECFKKDENIKKEENSVMYMGRLATIKKVDILIKAVKSLIEKGEKINLNIYGGYNSGDKEYFDSLKNIGKKIEEEGNLNFYGSVSNYMTPEIYNKNLICVNLTPKGNYDKTVLESMACGTIPVVSSIAFLDIIPQNLIFNEDNVDDLAQKIKTGLYLKKDELLEEFREYVVNKHDLDLLIREIKSKLSI